MDIGINSFGPKAELYEDFAGTIEKLKAAGITSLEPCVVMTDDMTPPEGFVIPPEVLRIMSGWIWSCQNAPEKLAQVRAMGLAAVSVHIFGGTESPERFLSVVPKAAAFGKENGVKCFVLSLMLGYEGLKAFAPAVKQATELLAEAGIMLAYHNHEAEFEAVDGQTALDCLLEACPLLKLELDVGWATFAGLDPVELMHRYRDRLVLLHLKDIKADACAENRATCFTAVGEGAVKLGAVLKRARECALLEHGIIIDQDDSETDILDDIALGVQNVRKCWETAERS